MRRSMVGLAIAIVLGAGACSSGSKAPPPGDGSPGATASSSRGPFGSGTAHLAVSGSVSATVDLPIDAASSQYRGAGVGFAAFWKDEKNNLLSVGGAAFSGERKTDSTLVLGFNVVQGATFAFATSSKGECTIKMTAGRASIQGSFTCAGVKSGDKTYNAAGTFSAKA